MPSRRKSASRLVQTDFWGNVVEESPAPSNNLIPLDFAEHRIRMVFIKGEPWWVAADVCRALGINNASQALSRLDEDERGIISNETPSGDRELLVVNESGLYNLILSSRIRKNSPAYEQIRAFRRWVTHEVLPEIRKTGTYVPRGGRVALEARRLKIDTDTAKVRCDQFAANKQIHRELAGTGACPRDFADWHNTIYLNHWGAKAREIKIRLGINNRASLLDYLENLPLQSNLHIKILWKERIKTLGGDVVPRETQLQILAEIAQEMAAFDAQRLGPGARIDLKDDPVRGRVIGVVRNELASPVGPESN